MESGLTNKDMRVQVHWSRKIWLDLLAVTEPEILVTKPTCKPCCESSGHCPEGSVQHRRLGPEVQGNTVFESRYDLVRSGGLSNFW
jgi:hypothetical protein